MGNFAIGRDSISKNFTLDSQVWLPKPLEEVFAFFSDAFQLETLTPEWLKFEALTPPPIEMRPGALIDYKLRLRGIPFRWRTRIEHWDPPHRFVDRQLRGPYRVWQHTHSFVERDGGTLVVDHVEYNVLGGLLVNRLLVSRDVESVFAYRHKTLCEIFQDEQSTSPCKRSENFPEQNRNRSRWLETAQKPCSINQQPGTHVNGPRDDPAGQNTGPAAADRQFLVC